MYLLLIEVLQREVSASLVVKEAPNNKSISEETSLKARSTAASLRKVHQGPNPLVLQAMLFQAVGAAHTPYRA
jgi:hypothetical protein